VKNPFSLLSRRIAFLSSLPDYEFFNVCIKGSNAWSYQMFIPLFCAEMDGKKTEERKGVCSLRMLRTLVYLMDLKLKDEWYERQLVGREEREERGEEIEVFAIDIFKEHFDLEQSNLDYFERLIRAHCIFSVEPEFQPLRSRLLNEESSGNITEDILSCIYDAYCKV
jgi:hypothetical protein